MTATTLMKQVASQINLAHANAVQHADTAIGFARQAGELLLKVKADLPRGEFLPWLAENCAVSDRQARRYMAAAQGKPTPIRAIKSDTVSVLEVNDGQAIYIKRIVGNWQDESFIYPNAEHPGYFHYAFVSGQVCSGASCTFTKRGISARGIGLMVGMDLPGWRDCQIDRFDHPGFVVNPFASEDVAHALGEVATTPLHKNLALAREMATQFIIDTGGAVDGNQVLFEMLDSGGEYGLIPLPGETLHDIVDNLKSLLRLACEPPICSRGKADAANSQREKIVILVRAALALLATEKGSAA